MRRKNDVRDVERAVDTPDDKSSREGGTFYQLDGENTIQGNSGGTENSIWTNTSGDPQYVRQVTFATRWWHDDSELAYSDALRFAITINDEDGQTQIGSHLHTENFPLTFTPAIKLEQDWSLDIEYNNPTPFDVVLDFTAVFREEVE
jgi:hypothetical protein